MSSGDSIPERVSRLEATVEALLKEEANCQARQTKAIDTLQHSINSTNEKLDKLISNEMVHIDARIKVLESAPKTTIQGESKIVLTVGDWIKIITAIITAIAGAYVIMGGKV